MATRIGINGFGRMGRLVVRALAHHEQIEIAHINELNCDAKTAAHLMQFDSVHGTWKHEAQEIDGKLALNGSLIQYSQVADPIEVPWEESDISIVLECTGTFRTVETLSSYLTQGIKKVIVAAPVNDQSVLNIVMGCNEHLYDSKQFDIVTAASCTTNCLAPVVKVLHEKIGINSGLITSIHAPKNTQVVVDKPHNDQRRARSAQNSLKPTSPRSATALPPIFPDSFRYAIIEPEKVIPPINKAINTTKYKNQSASALFSNSDQPTNKLAKPPKPLKRATSSGIPVICTRLAAINPTKPPITKPKVMNR